MFPDRATSPNFEAAIHLASIGFPVFPTQIEGEKRKQPVPGLLWRMHREAAPAIDLAKTAFFVVDCDAEKAGKHVHGVGWFRAECERREFDLSTIPIVTTPSGGWHCWFKQPADGERLGNSRGSLPSKADTGVDIRGSGGYVLGPGGEIDIGRYELLEGMEISEAPEAPAWLVDILRGKRAEAIPEAPAMAAPVPRAPIMGESSRREAYADEAFRREVHEVATTGDGGRNIRLNQAAFSLGQLVAGGVLVESEVWAALRGAAETCGLMRDDGPRSVDKTIRSGLRGGKARPRTGPEDDGAVGDLAHGAMLARRLLARSETGELVDPSTGEIVVAPRQTPAPRALPLVVASDLAGHEIPEREWLVPELVPAANVTLLSGDGGTGKSLLALQLAVATALGSAWIRRPVAWGKAVYLSAEDDIDELHRRLATIARSEGVRLDDLRKLFLIPLAGEDALLVAPQGGRSGNVVETPLWRAVASAVEEHQPALVVLDTSADLFGGDEINRAQVRQFVSMLRGLALRSKTTIVLLSHPSVAGMTSGSGLSGSTAWNNSVRSRLYLERPKSLDGAPADPDLRVLSTMKANYSSVGGRVEMKWSDGVFVPIDRPASAARAVGAAQVEGVFLSLLEKFNRQGRPVSPNPSTTYAPRIFEREPEANGIRARAFATAMSSLLDAERIEIIQVGPRSRPRATLRLVVDTT